MVHEIVRGKKLKKSSCLEQFHVYCIHSEGIFNNRIPFKRDKSNTFNSDVELLIRVKKSLNFK